MNKIEGFQGKYRFLSNFWPAKVWYDGVEYPTVEHAYQAAKTTIISERQLISEIGPAGEVKRLAKELTLRPDWDKVKLNIMQYLVRQKFKYDPLKQKLLNTEGMELVETNNWRDTFWGVCRGNGDNHLGKILMKVRIELR